MLKKIIGGILTLYALSSVSVPNVSAAGLTYSQIWGVIGLLSQIDDIGWQAVRNNFPNEAHFLQSLAICSSNDCGAVGPAIMSQNGYV
ncbi:MAG: hypothetical protein LBJ83_03235 [Oscillospiraceae bacterium]|jgi:hypothetical protein|nr:hypothetical protein [Oscillospiraceae bacterium]